MFCKYQQVIPALRYVRSRAVYTQATQHTYLVFYKYVQQKHTYVLVVSAGRTLLI